MGWTTKNLCLRIFCVGVVLAFLLLYALCPFTFLQGELLSKLGARAANATYFINSPTCLAREKQSLTIFDLPYVEGEQVRYDIKSEDFLQNTLESLAAVVLWTEEVDGVTSYYAKSDRLSKSVLISGALVNLHIAIKENEIVVGTPIIFGSY